MNKMEYMKQLNNQLLDINEDDRKEILADFEQHFEQGMLEGKTEEEIADSLGDITEWIEELKQKPNATKKQVEFAYVPEKTINQIKAVTTAAAVVIGPSKDGQIHYELTDKIARINIHNYYVDETIIDGTLQLKVIQKQKKLFNFDSLNLTLNIELPNFMKHVEIATVSGNILIMDLSCEQIELQSTSGNIKLERLDGQCSVRTVSGEINCKEVKKNLSFKTVSGDINGTGCFTEMVQMKSVSGDMEWNDGYSRMIVFDTLSGDIDFAGVAENIQVQTKSGDVNLETKQLQALKADSVSGDITLTLLDCQGLNCVLKTVSGDVDFDFKSPYRYSRNLLCFGDESCACSIKTISGDISINN